MPMNASIPALLVLLVLAGSWGLGRRRSRPFLRSTDAGAVAALNRAQIERVQDPAVPYLAAVHQADAPSPGSVPPARPGALAGGPIACPSFSKVRLLVDSWGSRSRQERLALLELARRQPQPVLLPLLRRALRDPDPQLVAAAAAALERYRGRPWTGAGNGVVAASGPVSGARPAARPGSRTPSRSVSPRG